MLAASLNLYSTPASDVNIQPVEAQMAPALQQFKFVAARLARTTTSLDNIQPGSSRSSGSEKAKQLNSYISSIGTSRCTGLLISAEASVHGPLVDQYHKLAPVALAEHASQAYVERIFSVFGLLTAGRRN